MAGNRATKVGAWTASVALVAGVLVAAPALGLAPATPAEAADVTCEQLLDGMPCTLAYEDYPDATRIFTPAGIEQVTVMLAGASGAPGTDEDADPGPGGVVIATIEVAPDSPLEVWLAEQPDGRHGGDGWAPGGDGGDRDNGPDGRGAGAASGLAYAASGHDAPLMVAGGGGGGGGDVVGLSGGVGGYASDPAGDGANGKGNFYGAGGTGGGESGSAGGHGQEGNEIGVGGAGGGGGGGYRGGEGGGAGWYTPQFGYSTAGGGGGGLSWVDETGVDLLGYGTAPLGDGFITLYPGVSQRLECDGSSDPNTFPVAPGVEAYTVIAVGGAGGIGNNVGHGGHGAVVTGIVFVAGMEELTYWVGCSGDRRDDAGAGYGVGGEPGRPESSIANDGGRGGGGTALAAPDGTMLIAAGGGGGVGGDLGDCNTAPGPRCGGLGGSGGGVPGSSLPANGVTGDGGDGGHGGTADAHTENGEPDIDGGHGVTPGGDNPAGGGGGGGGGYPMGGDGGHHKTLAAGGGGGAGGSYFNSQYVTGGTIGTSGSFATNEDPADGYLLMLPIQLTTVDLTVRKQLSGAASTYAQPPFGMSVECRFGSHVVYENSFELDADEGVTSPVPGGSECTVTETTTGGSSFPAPPQTVEVNEDLTVTMTNQFAPTDLVLTVESVVIDEADQEVTDVHLDPGAMRLSVSCTLDGHQIAVPAPAVNGVVTFDGEATFADGGASQTLEGLPETAMCAVTELPGPGASRTDYLINGLPAGGGQVFELAPISNTVVVGNGFDLAPISLEKVLDGDGTPPDDAVFGGSVTCTFNGQPVGFDDPRTFAGLAVGGTVLVHDLPVGAQCTVDESDSASADAVNYIPGQTLLVTDGGTAQLEIQNVYDDGSLIVHVQSSGAGLAWANQDLSLHVTCTVFDGENDQTVLDDTFSLPPSGGWRSYDVLEEATCTVVEDVTGGATAVTYTATGDPTPSTDPLAVTIGAGATLGVQNVFAAAPIDVSVAVTGAGVRFAGTTTVTVGDCTFNGEAIEFSPGVAERQFPFPPAGGVATIPELVVGATCLASLSDDGGATSASVQVTNGAPAVPQGDDATTFTLNQPGTAIAFTTVFDVAALDVTKVVDGAAAWAANTAYAATVVCTLDGAPITELGPDGTVVLGFEPDGTPVDDHARELLGELPVGASCTVSETEDGGATTVAISPEQPAVVSADGAEVTITNTFSPATVQVAKVVGGNDVIAHEDDVFWFELGCTFNDKPIGNPPTDPDRPLTFGLDGGETASFADRPVGADCEAVEFRDNHATSVTPDTTQTAVLAAQPATMTFTNTFDTASLTVTEQLIGDGAQTYGEPQTFFVKVVCTYPDGEVVDLPDFGELELDELDGFTAELEVPVGTTCVAEQEWQKATRQLKTPPVTTLLGDDHTITITSDFAVGALAVAKTALGNYPATQEFGFTTTCTWPVLGGTEALPLNGDLPNAFALRSGQNRAAEALVGSTCTTSETSAVGALRVVAEATGRDAAVSGASASIVAWENEPGSVRVTNYMPGSLPVTGAEAGTGLLVALGLLALGVLVLVLRRVRRARA